MPWSAWIQSDDYSAGTPRIFFQEKYGADPSVMGFTAGGPALVDAGYPTSTVGQGEQLGTQFTNDGSWLEDRDWFPNELDGLVEGTDYGVRPDRSPFDDDAYIEYESGANVLTGWAFRAATVQSAAGGTGWALYLVDGTSIVVGANPSPTVGGTPFAFGDGSTPVGTVLPLPPQPASDQFAIIARLNSPITEAAMSASFPSPTIKYRMPRWRYWVPGDSWVKLKNRGDGLGMSTKRLRGRGTSNQAGRLRGSY